jgi:LPS sulfotransferase NodH
MAAKMRADVAVSVTAPAARPRHGRRVRVGYLSSDFRDHPTSRLLLGLLRHHDLQRFEIYLYCSGWDDGSPIRQALVQAVGPRFVSVADLSDEAAAQRIRADGIDVLAELNGPTHANRMGILLHRPAPVQLDYLGWPGSVGGPAVDYVVGDDYTVPPSAERLYPEKVIRLHRVYQINDYAAATLQAAPTRAACALPEQGFVLGMFNQINKVRTEVWAVWMDIMQAVPAAVLWVLDPGDYAMGNIRTTTAQAGIDPARIRVAPKCPQGSHLARLQLCDLMLDPWPYGGHTTTSDALFAGVPVVALEGRNFAGRVSGALLNAAGLGALVAPDRAAYVARAVRLLTDDVLRASLRRFVREGVPKTNVFDARDKTLQFEAAFLRALDLAVAGKPPEPMSLKPRHPTEQPEFAWPALSDTEFLAQQRSPPEVAAAAPAAPKGPLAKFDFLMSAQRDFTHYPDRPFCRYLLCSTARSGSNMVSDMLRQTRMAGEPMEYLNQAYMAGELRARGTAATQQSMAWADYLDALEQRRTSPNGWFGLKAHFEHIERQWRDQRPLVEGLLRRFDRFVLLRRRDKLAQAVSLYRARATQIWSSMDEQFMDQDDPRRAVVVSFDADRIARALADIVHQETQWERCLQTLKLPYAVFWYEDFMADYRLASASLLGVLGIAQAIDLVGVPSIRRQGRDDDPFVIQFRQVLGCPAPGAGETP